MGHQGIRFGLTGGGDVQRQDQEVYDLPYEIAGKPAAGWVVWGRGQGVGKVTV